MMYQWIYTQHQHEIQLPVSRLCQALSVSKKGVLERETLNADPPGDKERLIEGHANELLLYFC